MPDTPTHQQLVVFSLGRDEYALPITQVQEIVRFTEPRPLHAAAPGIAGAIDLRGSEVPVCDLATRLDVDADAGEATKIVIVDTGSGAAGLIVGHVHEVMSVARDQIDAGVASLDGRRVTLLDAELIFSGFETEAAA